MTDYLEEPTLFDRVGRSPKPSRTRSPRDLSCKSQSRETLVVSYEEITIKPESEQNPYGDTNVYEEGSEMEELEKNEFLYYPKQSNIYSVSYSEVEHNPEPNHAAYVEESNAYDSEVSLTPIKVPASKTPPSTPPSQRKKKNDNQPPPEQKFPEVAVIDWNKRYQQLIDQIENLEIQQKTVRKKSSLMDSTALEEKLSESYSKLANLCRDFLFNAMQIGKVIISEINTPDFLKTIKPEYHFLGFAGGSKYIVRGIFFKFADNENNLFNSDEDAQNSARAELRNLQAIQSIPALASTFSFPLMAIIDYMGYRIIAQSFLYSLSKESLIYGSANGGSEIHKDDVEVNKKAKQLGTSLNLKKHEVGNSRVKVYTCADLEIHRGKDKKLYILDFARLFPPEARGVFETSENKRAIHLYRFLRPELIKTNTSALSSDAFSKFEYFKGKATPESEISDEEVFKATVRLKNEVIPQFSAYLDSLPERKIEEYPRGFQLVSELHKFGINIRHLASMKLFWRTNKLLKCTFFNKKLQKKKKGYVRALVKNKNWKSLILLEMIARVTKNLTAVLMRKKKTLKTDFSGDTWQKETIIGLFNSIFGKFYKSFPEDTFNEDSLNFWKNKLPSYLKAKFGSFIFEKDPPFETLHSLLCPKHQNGKEMVTVILHRFAKLFARIETLTELRLRGFNWNAVGPSLDGEEFRSNFPFSENSFSEIQARITYLDIISYAEAKSAQLSSRNLGLKDKSKMLLFAESKLSMCISTTQNPTWILEFAKVCFQIGITSQLNQSITTALETGLDQWKAATQMMPTEETRPLFKEALNWNNFTLKKLTGHFAEVRDFCLDFKEESAIPKLLISCGLDSSMNVYNLQNNNLEPTSKLKMPQIVTFAVQRKSGIVACGFFDGTIRLYKSSNLSNPVTEFQPNTGTVTFLSFHPKLKNILLINSTTFDSVEAWDIIEQRKCFTKQHLIAKKKPVRVFVFKDDDLEFEPYINSDFDCAAFSEFDSIQDYRNSLLLTNCGRAVSRWAVDYYDHDIFISYSSNNLVHWKYNKELKTFKLNKYNSHFSEIKSIFVRNDSVFTGYSNGSIRQFDIKTKKLLNFCKGHLGSVNSVYCEDSILVSGASDSTVKIWKISKSSIDCIRTLFDETMLSVTQVHFQNVSQSSNPRIIASSFENCIRIWDFEKPSEIDYQSAFWAKTESM